MKYRDNTENRTNPQDGGGGNASSVATAAIELERQRRNLKAETQQTAGQKEKFNFVEEFFICLACIFD